jgi:hypothetical protein
MVARLLGRIAAVGVRSVAVGTLTVAAAVGVIALGIVNWTASDRSHEVGGDAFVESVFSGLPPNAAILTPWDGSTPLWHAKYVWVNGPTSSSTIRTSCTTDGKPARRGSRR